MARFVLYLASSASNFYPSLGIGVADRSILCIFLRTLDQMPYVTVFDISKQPFDWWFPAFGLIFVALGLFFVFFLSKRPGQKGAKFIGWFMVIFASFWTFSGFSGMYTVYSGFIKAYKTGQYEIVEGLVQDFHPMPYSGHEDECFRVEDARFCYSDYTVEPGFRQSASHGGPIREGLPVRIAYLSGRILRLEIRADQVPEAASVLAHKQAEEAKWNEQLKTDPVLTRLFLGFAIAMVVVTLWWNLDWKHFMRYWLLRAPPYSKPWEIGFRTFFLFSLLGAAVNFVRQVHERSRTVKEFALGVTVSLLWIAFFVIMDLYFRKRWQAEKNF